jgi:hypothetical protein
MTDLSKRAIACKGLRSRLIDGTFTQEPKPDESFWSKVNKGETCWTWTRGKDKKGYGRAWFDSKNRLAHHVAFFLDSKRWPESEVIMHSCDNPACVRPAHLKEGTHRENYEDSVRKGRRNRARGERTSTSRLTLDIVRECRFRHREGETGVDLAREFGVSKSAMCRAIKGVTWKHA